MNAAVRSLKRLQSIRLLQQHVQELEYKLLVSRSALIDESLSWLEQQVRGSRVQCVEDLMSEKPQSAVFSQGSYEDCRRLMPVIREKVLEAGIAADRSRSMLDQATLECRTVTTLVERRQAVDNQRAERKQQAELDQIFLLTRRKQS